jgi:hypothetical protein
MKTCEFICLFSSTVSNFNMECLKIYDIVKIFAGVGLRSQCLHIGTGHVKYGIINWILKPVLKLYFYFLP